MQAPVPLVAGLNGPQGIDYSWLTGKLYIATRGSSFRGDLI